MKTKPVLIVVSILGAGLLVGAGIFGMGYLNYKYKMEVLDQNTQKEKQSEQLLNNCLDEAGKRFSTTLEDPRNKNLDRSAFQIIIDFNQKQRDECFKKYTQK